MEYPINSPEAKLARVEETARRMLNNCHSARGAYDMARHNAGDYPRQSSRAIEWQAVAAAILRLSGGSV